MSAYVTNQFVNQQSVFLVPSGVGRCGPHKKGRLLKAPEKGEGVNPLLIGQGFCRSSFFSDVCVCVYVCILYMYLCLCLCLCKTMYMHVGTYLPTYQRMYDNICMYMRT